MERSFIETIVNGIVLEEKEEHNIDFSFKAYTKKEYYKSDEFKKGLKASFPFNLSYFLVAANNNEAYYSRKFNYAILFIDGYLNKKNPNKNLFSLLFTTYHEIRHAYQRNKTMSDKLKGTRETIKDFNLKDSNLFLYQMENVTNFFDYEYDKVWSEIDANNYALLKTVKFLEKNNQNDIYKDFVEETSLVNEARRINYDFNEVFNLFNELIRRKYVDIKDTWLELFYNEDYSFKTISEIYEKEDDYNINHEIVTLIITSDYYIKNIKINEIDKGDLQIYLDLINYRDQLKKYKEIKLKKILSIFEEKNNKEKTFKKN